MCVGDWKLKVIFFSPLYFLQMHVQWMWFPIKDAMWTVATLNVHLNEPQDGPLGYVQTS